MINLGLPASAKAAVIQRYVDEHGIRKVVIVSPPEFNFPHTLANAEEIDYLEIVEYHVFHRLMQEIDPQTLLVVNECLRSQKRHDLHYNCVRNFLNQTTHQLIFQFLPIIASVEDFMVLFDWDTRSRWKREAFDPQLVMAARVQLVPADLQFSLTEAPIEDKLLASYEAKKTKLFAELGNKDPDTLPRHLYKHGAPAKRRELRPSATYLSTRSFGPQVIPYHTAGAEAQGIFEFPHRHIDLCDFVSRTGRTQFEVITTPLKVDQWYVQRYREWQKEVARAYSAFSY